MYEVNVNKLVGKIAEKGFSREGFAKKIGISRETLRNYINNPSKMTVEIIQKASEALELSAGEALDIFFNA